MKFFHLSDLHLGKRVNGYSMLADQQYILDEILKLAEAEAPDAVLLAGDLYDKGVPPTEAVTLLDDFLTALAARGIPVLGISGNHDSPERIAFAARLLRQSGVYLSPVYDGSILPIELTDEWGALRVYLLPFVKPAQVRRLFPQKTIESYTDAMAAAIEGMQLDPTVRNLLVTHQFVIGAERSDSEELSAGGTDQVAGAVFADFDYVALGHLHAPQRVGRETLRYSGTPLKYSFSEVHHQKSVTVVEMREKGQTSIRTLPLTPLHDLREIRGNYDELMSRQTYEHTAREDYLHITLTDEEDIPDGMRRLQTVYPNLMKVDYDNTRTRSRQTVAAIDTVERLSPLELVEQFYTTQNNQPLSSQQRAYLTDLLASLGEKG